MNTCAMVNLQTGFGGGEVYTRFACTALRSKGWRVVLYIHRRATFLKTLQEQGVETRAIGGQAEIDIRDLGSETVVLTHGILEPPVAADLAASNAIAGVIHMPVAGRGHLDVSSYARLLGVSQYVVETIRAHWPEKCHAEPLWGVADLAPRGQHGSFVRRSPYIPDPRKPRDRMVAWLSSCRMKLSRTQPFCRRQGLTLGVVSRFTPIKQFGSLFEILVPILMRRPQVNLELIGGGGVSSIRELARTLRPLGDRVRFWGHQQSVVDVFPEFDFVISGLPEKEALGLNLIEAQAAGTPVLAVRAPPFTETVIDGRTGYLYRDPREDNGIDFERVLDRILNGERPPDPRLAKSHLHRFSHAAFSDRLDRALRGPWAS